MPEEKKTEVAEMIRNLRAKVGVTWLTANRWENGRGKPSSLGLRCIEEV